MNTFIVYRSSKDRIDDSHYPWCLAWPFFLNEKLLKLQGLLGSSIMARDSVTGVSAEKCCSLPARLLGLSLRIVIFDHSCSSFHIIIDLSLKKMHCSSSNSREQLLQLENMHCLPNAIEECAYPHDW